MIAGFKHKPADTMHNRRHMAVLCLLFFILWGFVILICTILFDFETSKVVAFLGFIATMSGTGIIGYLHASHKDDQNGEDS